MDSVTSKFYTFYYYCSSSISWGWTIGWKNLHIFKYECVIGCNSDIILILSIFDVFRNVFSFCLLWSLLFALYAAIHSYMLYCAFYVVFCGNILSLYFQSSYFNYFTYFIVFSSFAKDGVFFSFFLRLLESRIPFCEVHLLYKLVCFSVAVFCHYS